MEYLLSSSRQRDNGAFDEGNHGNVPAAAGDVGAMADSSNNSTLRG